MSKQIEQRDWERYVEYRDEVERFRRDMSKEGTKKCYEGARKQRELLARLEKEGVELEGLDDRYWDSVRLFEERHDRQPWEDTK